MSSQVQTIRLVAILTAPELSLYGEIQASEHYSPFEQKRCMDARCQYVNRTRRAALRVADNDVFDVGPTLMLT